MDATDTARARTLERRMSASEEETEIYRFPDFFDRLKERGVLHMRDAVEERTEIDGLLYHHRGVQVPAEAASFVWDADRSTDGTLRLEVDGLGGRRLWADFDAGHSWDIYVVLFQTGAAVAWMSDAEFEHEEATAFPTKSAAIRAGRFSFGTFFVVGPDWLERESWAASSSAPGLLQLGDGRVLDPPSEDIFYQAYEAIPTELREDPGDPPGYLGLLDVGLTGAE